ncbi:MAG TPA: hypothetical protein VHP33_28070 [Polyangiaceae bacterium]|nr:hypothetical protein [Polyangiaceae bacterium]
MVKGFDRVRLAMQSGASIPTIVRVYKGLGSNYSRARVSAAAEQLGLPMPPERSTSLSPASSPGLAKTSQTP